MCDSSEIINDRKILNTSNNVLPELNIFMFEWFESVEVVEVVEVVQVQKTLHIFFWRRAYSCES